MRGWNINIFFFLGANFKPNNNIRGNKEFQNVWLLKKVRHCLIDSNYPNFRLNFSRSSLYTNVFFRSSLYCYTLMCFWGFSSDQTHVGSRFKRQIKRLQWKTYKIASYHSHIIIIAVAWWIQPNWQLDLKFFTALSCYMAYTECTYSSARQ